MKRLWCVLLLAGLCFSVQAQAEPIDPHFLALQERIVALEQQSNIHAEVLDYIISTLYVFFARLYVALEDGVITVDPESSFVEEFQEFVLDFVEGLESYRSR